MRSLRILHITNDEKFVSSALAQFKAVKNCESCFLLPIPDLVDSRFVSKEYEGGNIRIMCEPYHTDRYFKLIFESNADLIFIHGLSMAHKVIVDKIDHKFNLFWLSWGRDIFSSSALSHLMYKHKTKKLLDKIDDSKSLRKRLGKVVYWILRPKNRINTDSGQYLKYFKYMSCVVKEDYNSLTKAYPKAEEIKYIPFNYLGFAKESSTTKEAVSGRDILLGNSANPENNHLECFDLLSKIDLEDRKVIVPLSYGGNEKYIKAVISEGQRLLGGNFVPLNNFLKKDEYNRILSNVSIALMNHSHQHAMGNIWYVLCQGTKVFMDFDNTAAQALKRLGVTIFDINTVSVEIDKPLSQETIDNNRKAILSEYGDAAVLKRTQDFVDYFIEELEC